MDDWPEPIRTLRSFLPGEARLLRGGVGLLAGVLIVSEIIVLVLGGNWQMGYSNDWILASIFLLLVPAAVGIMSPLWYWIGRPGWDRFERPGDRLLHRWRQARFVPGLVGAFVGVSLMFPVSATSRFWVQTLVPFGLAIGLASTLWFWLLRPLASSKLDAVLPGDPSSKPVVIIQRGLPTIGILFVIGVAITAAISLPVVTIGESVTTGDMAVSITDTRTTTTVTESNGRTFEATHGWQLLLVHLTVENRGESPRMLPGRSFGDITVIAPECSANNFGEPSNNCNRAFVDGRFNADGEEYANYDEQQAATSGMIGPRERISGWLVFRLENQPTNGNEFEPMVVVDDVGRWSLEDQWVGQSSTPS